MKNPKPQNPIKEIFLGMEQKAMQQILNKQPYEYAWEYIDPYVINLQFLKAEKRVEPQP